MADRKRIVPELFHAGGAELMVIDGAPVVRLQINAYHFELPLEVADLLGREMAVAAGRGHRLTFDEELGSFVELGSSVKTVKRRG